ncbi:MAG: hypothetical protein PGN23_15295 [Sphingomonas adhaesiva]|uniref:hypothetical protein n=1 Tax=Sphingomonas adhaesiva TaxID=28212 RepID=UPI002FF4DDC1
MFEIRFDPAQRVLHLTLSGFWTMATVVRFAAEMMLRATMIRARYGTFATLSDARDFPIQSAAVSERFERIRARGLEMNLGPTAIVVASQLSKLQAERVLKTEQVRVFLDRAAAEAWLEAQWALHPGAATEG